MFELHSLIKKLQERRALFEYRYTEEDDLVKVKETLNKRLVVLREKLIEDPNNESVILEYGFCAEEVERITKDSNTSEKNTQPKKQKYKNTKH